MTLTIFIEIRLRIHIKFDIQFLSK